MLYAHSPRSANLKAWQQGVMSALGQPGVRYAPSPLVALREVAAAAAAAAAPGHGRGDAPVAYCGERVQRYGQHGVVSGATLSGLFERVRARVREGPGQAKAKSKG